MQACIYTYNFHQLNTNELHYVDLSALTITDDIDVFFKHPSECKVVVINVEHESSNSHVMLSMIERVRNIADLVIIYSVELTSSIVRYIERYDLPHFHFIIGGRINFETTNATIEYNPYWLATTSHSYFHGRAEILTKGLHPYKAKPFHCEVLYGLEKPHRRFVKDWMTNIQDNFFALQSEFLKNQSVTDKCLPVGPSIFWEDDIVKCGDGRVDYRGNITLPSQIVPIKVYNQAAYSVVCESECYNEFSFFTEKIAKPMLAQRLFVVIAGQHYLRNLRTLGFKTFGGIIDESYDSIADDHERWNAALNEILKLRSRDQVEVFKECGIIFRHNYERLREIVATFNQVEVAVAELLIARGFT